MYIFYDFETSSRELIGQIISYAFVVTDKDLNPIQEFTGLVKLNRLQCPEVDAILINKVNIDSLQEQGDSEYDAAHKIHHFLNSMINEYGSCTLVGFNSNQFDLSFLRLTFIRYGLNPYFKGKLKNSDILHWSRYLAFFYPDMFPWVLTQNEKHCYYSFRLEDLTQSSQLLQEDQSHDALEDVLLTIKLVQHFQLRFNINFSDFEPTFIPTSSDSQETFYLAKQRTTDFVELGQSPQKFTFNYFMSLSRHAKCLLFVDLQKAKDVFSHENPSDEEKLSCIKYINTNKHMFILEPCDPEETLPFQSIPDIINDDPFFSQFKQDATFYFDCIKKEWDIEYQIHELGFERIDTLHHVIDSFIKNPDNYPSILQGLLSRRKSPKDTYLIQLFNRVYLNYHPSPPKDHISRYTKPRYIDGTLYKDDAHTNFFETDYQKLTDYMNDPNYESEFYLLEPLKRYFDNFKLML